MNKLWNIKYLVVLAAVVGVFALPGSVSALDDDGDSVDSSIENTAPNGGDNNYDNEVDANQDTVASIPNPNDDAAPGSYVTLQVGDTYECGGVEFTQTCEDSAWKIDEFKAVDVATLPSQPDNTVFPLGLFEIKLSCQNYPRSFQSIDSNVGYCYTWQKVETEEGCEWQQVPIPASLKLIFDRVLDTTNWTTQKYDPNTDTYIDYSPYVTIEQYNEEFGYARTVIKWSITDGEFGDTDGEANGYISDPIGPSVPTAKGSTVEIVPASAPGKTLANTGVDSSIIVLFGFALIAGGAVLLPKQN